jgi:hypothetical protein
MTKMPSQPVTTNSPAKVLDEPRVNPRINWPDRVGWVNDDLCFHGRNGSLKDTISEVGR